MHTSKFPSVPNKLTAVFVVIRAAPWATGSLEQTLVEISVSVIDVLFMSFANLMIADNTDRSLQGCAT